MKALSKDSDQFASAFKELRKAVLDSRPAILSKEEVGAIEDFVSCADHLGGGRESS